MSNSNPTQRRKHNPEMLRAKKFARLLGVPWSVVVEQRNKLQAIEREQRVADDEARQAGWHAFVHFHGWSDSCLPLWRCGFQRQYGSMMARGGDITNIPRHDEIAGSVRSQCPSFTDWSTEDIWELLLSDYPPLRPVGEHYRNAVALVAAGELSSDVPF